MQQPKNGIFSGTNYNRFNFMERPRDLQVREHGNTDAIDIFLALFKALAFHR